MQRDKGALGSKHADPELYQATRAGRFDRVLRSVPIAPADYTFVDMGCSKGRALLLAARFGFRDIVGVEIEDARAAAIDVHGPLRAPSARGRRRRQYAGRGAAALPHVGDHAPSVTAAVCA